MPKPYRKDPDAILDYYVNWSDWLEDDTIITSTWELVEGDVELGLGIDLGSVQGTWVSGGTVGSNALLTNHIITSDGRHEDGSILLVIKEQ